MSVQVTSNISFFLAANQLNTYSLYLAPYRSKEVS